MISIHALRVEGDLVAVSLSGVINAFLSTPSGWRATKQFDYPVYIDLEISIHALRVEGDFIHSVEQDYDTEFLSTPSGWRATMIVVLCLSIVADFYPRPPGGGRLSFIFAMGALLSISIHALRVEGDCHFQCLLSQDHYFYPRPPGGGRLSSCRHLRRLSHFYPRPPGGGRPNVPTMSRKD